MIEELASYIMDKCDSLERGTNFFVGHIPDKTAKISNGVLVGLLQSYVNYDEWSKEQTHATFGFSLRFIGDSYRSTYIYAMDICSAIRNIHGAEIDGDDCIYHCGNISVIGPRYITIDAKNRFVYNANLKFYCQRIDSVEEGT